MRRILLILTSLLAVFAMSATAAYAGNGKNSKAKNRTIADVVIASGGEFDNNHKDFDILLNAVVTADLAETLSSPDINYTVFAPTDIAFVKLATDLGFTGAGEEAAWNFLVGALTELGGGDPIPVLTSVLLYHVAPERLTIDNVLFDSDTVTTALDGATFSVDRRSLIDNDPDVKNAKVSLRRSNIRANNGMVHTIDRVLIPLDL